MHPEIAKRHQILKNLVDQKIEELRKNREPTFTPILNPKTIELAENRKDKVSKKSKKEKKVKPEVMLTNSVDEKKTKEKKLKKKKKKRKKIVDQAAPQDMEGAGSENILKITETLQKNLQKYFGETLNKSQKEIEIVQPKKTKLTNEEALTILKDTIGILDRDGSETLHSIMKRRRKNERAVMNDKAQKQQHEEEVYPEIRQSHEGEVLLQENIRHRNSGDQKERSLEEAFDSAQRREQSESLREVHINEILQTDDLLKRAWEIARAEELLQQKVFSTKKNSIQTIKSIDGGVAADLDQKAQAFRKGKDKSKSAEKKSIPSKSKGHRRLGEHSASSKTKIISSARDLFKTQEKAQRSRSLSARPDSRNEKDRTQRGSQKRGRMSAVDLNKQRKIKPFLHSEFRTMSYNHIEKSFDRDSSRELFNIRDLSQEYPSRGNSQNLSETIAKANTTTSPAKDPNNASGILRQSKLSEGQANRRASPTKKVVIVEDSYNAKSLNVNSNFSSQDSPMKLETSGQKGLTKKQWETGSFDSRVLKGNSSQTQDSQYDISSETISKTSNYSSPSPTKSQKRSMSHLSQRTERSLSSSPDLSRDSSKLYKNSNNKSKGSNKMNQSRESETISPERERSLKVAPVSRGNAPRHISGKISNSAGHKREQNFSSGVTSQKSSHGDLFKTQQSNSPSSKSRSNSANPPAKLQTLLDRRFSEIENNKKQLSYVPKRDVSENEEAITLKLWEDKTEKIRERKARIDSIIAEMETPPLETPKPTLKKKPLLPKSNYGSQSKKHLESQQNNFERTNNSLEESKVSTSNLHQRTGKSNERSLNDSWSSEKKNSLPSSLPDDDGSRMEHMRIMMKYLPENQ